jgi:hypothetical protein
MALFPETRFDDWTRLDVASFAKRYHAPLLRLARLDFPSIDEATAQDLTQAFVLRELERTPIFERYAPARGHDARFRTFLRACFWRFCRDELQKSSRRAGTSLDALPDDPPDDAQGTELDRLAARDLLARLRDDVLHGGRGPLDPDAARYFELKWPADLEAAPRPDAEVGLELGLTRAKLRTLKRKVVDRILLAIRGRLRDDGLDPEAVDEALAGYVAALGREDASDPGSNPGDGHGAVDGGDGEGSG